MGLGRTPAVVGKKSTLMDNNQKIHLPKTTKDLLTTLQELYPKDELLSLYEVGDQKKISEYVGKLKLIDELLDLLKEEEEEMQMERLLST